MDGSFYHIREDAGQSYLLRNGAYWAFCAPGSTFEGLRGVRVGLGREKRFLGELEWLSWPLWNWPAAIHIAQGRDKRCRAR